MNFSVTNSSEERRFFLAVLDNEQLSVARSSARDVEKSVRDTACCLRTGNENVSLVSISSYTSVHIILKCYRFATFTRKGNSFMSGLI